MHCPVAAIFDTLLELEQSYAIAIQELQTASDHELINIQARQAQEIENNNTMDTTEDNMTNIFTRQVEEMEVFQATWQSDIMQTQQTQRQEYREFVIELYKEYQSRLSLISDEKLQSSMIEKKLNGKEIVAIAASRVRQWDHQANNNNNSNEGSIKSASSSNNTNPIITRRRTGSLASSLGSIQSPNLQQQQHSPNEIASLVSNPSISEIVHNEEYVKNIQEMGFEKDQAETALLLSNQNMEAAIGLLLENPVKVDAYITEQKFQLQQQQQQEKFQSMPRPPASSSTPCRRSHSLSQVPRPNLSTISSPTTSINSNNNNETSRRRSLQKFATTPTFLNIMSSNSTSKSSAPSTNTAIPSSLNSNKSWNPISFLQQQKQNMENTNLSSVRKLGGWLGKAMENFGVEHNENEINGRLVNYHQQQKQFNQPQLVESFTIMMGTTQIKSSHNLRLLVTDESTEIFNPVYDPPREMAYRAETATKLYTSHLSAVIVLTEVNEVTRKKRQYKFGKGSNKSLFTRCQQSTEFHFGDIESQISAIEKDFELYPEGLKEGSFFVTKHSNLPSTQVIFHLLIDSANVVTQDVSNRHPLIIGLKNILKMTTQFDISSLSIPLLLLPDRFNEKRDSNWLQKRGEVVMKCIKGFLIENSRSGKRVQNEGLDRAESMAGGGMRNIEFLLPSQPDVYGPIPSTVEHITTTGSAPQEVEVAFQQFRSLLVNLFRTS